MLSEQMARIMKCGAAIKKKNMKSDFTARYLNRIWLERDWISFEFLLQNHRAQIRYEKTTDSSH